MLAELRWTHNSCTANKLQTKTKNLPSDARRLRCTIGRSSQ